MKNLAQLTLALVVSLSATGNALAVDRFVASTGSDVNAGTITSPWKTIQKAANSAKAGDTVFVRAGSFKEKVQINVSGTAAAPITFRNYEGEVAILDLTGAAVGNDLSAVIRIPSRNYVTVQGFEIRNFRTASEASVPCGILVDGNCTGVKLIGNKIHHIEQNNTVEGNWDANGHGIAIYGTVSISNVLISGNELSFLRLGASEALAINGNVSNFTVSNNVVHHANNIGIDAIGFEGTCATASLDRARNGVICGNTVYAIDSRTNPAYEGNFSTGGGYAAVAGIYVDGGTSIVIERNRVYDCNYGIELASEAEGGVTDAITVRNNLIHHNHQAGLILGGYDEYRGATKNCSVLNNTLYLNDSLKSYSGQIQVQFYVTNVSFKNNVIWARGDTKQILVHAPEGDDPSSAQKEFSSTNTFAYNLYYCVGGSSANVSFEVFNKGAQRNYTSTAAWASSGVSKSDVGSSFVNPKLAVASPVVSSPMSAFKPALGSPAINTAQPSPAFMAAATEIDVLGELRTKSGRVDRGAAEF